MLPATSTHRFSLADVLPNCLAAVRGERGSLALPAVTHAVVLLVDGLGAAQLAQHAGHARTLAGAQTAKSAIGVGFPTTTAAAITTFTTGTRPGAHGHVGYSVLDPANDRVVNQLSGWDARLDPRTWQRMPTVFEQAETLGVPSFAIGPARYSDSGFTAAALRGAQYLSAASMADRFARTRTVLSTTRSALVYVYVPELDMAAHRHGVASGEWTAELEELDGELRAFLPALGSRQGLLVTADHGVVDVPESAHVILDPAWLAGVRHVAGEPRALQLHLDAGVDAEQVAERLRTALGRAAWVATRDAAVAGDWFGAVDPAVAPRIGDVLVVARTRTAFYTSSDDRGRSMVGQHGALTPEEVAVPLLRFGAFAA